MPENNDIRSYVLLMDRDRDMILNFMMTSAMKDPRFQRTLMNKGLVETFNSFIEDSADKSHPLGWCTDPNCLWKPKEKKA